MNRLSSIKRYTAINDGSAGESPRSSRMSWYRTSHQSPRDTSPPEYELSEQKIALRLSSPQSDISGSWLSKHRYSAVTSLNPSKESFQVGISAGKVDTGFSPLFTRRWILLCFAVLWVMIIVSLQIIYSVSVAQQGLATTSASMRYIWTYGPTAFLIVCTVMWRQVDYAAKYIQPWAALAKGPLPAEQTLLLDYITNFQLVAFWKALKSRHVTVASTILIFILIKVLTIISTGLLALQATPIEDVHQAMEVTTVFNTTATLPMAQVDSRAAMALYGHEQYRMFLPNGTTEQYAFQLFEPGFELLDKIVTYNASVDVFTAAGWDCESGNLTYENGFDYDGDGDFGFEITPVSSYYNTTVKLPDCEIHNGHLDAPSWYLAEDSPDPLYGYWGTFQRVNCSNLDPTDPKFNRYMISVAYSKGLGQNDNIMLNSSNIVCRPSYGIQPGYVTRSEDGTPGDIVLSNAPHTLAGVTPDDLALAVWTTIRQAGLQAEIDTYNVTSDTFVANMIRLTPNFEWDMLLNNTWLADKSRQVYQRTAAQIAGLYLLSLTDQGSSFDGSITRIEQRLVVKALPTRLMQACAAFMLVLTVIMIVTVSQNVVPRPVESVASIAVILARSPSLLDLLKDTGHLGADQLRSALSGYKFMSTVADAPHGKTFTIRAIANSGTSPPPLSDRRIRWTQPLVLHRVVMILTLCLAVAVLIALEVLYQQALVHNGLANVENDSVQRYVWLYTPTVVLILLATTFNLLDFELEFTDPYHELVRGGAMSTSILWDPLRNISPQTCFHAFRHSRFALVASTISVIVAPMLTIVVSGLFLAQPVSHSETFQVSAETWFNVSSSADYGTSAEAYSFAIPALILQGNMSYPQWTYDELAFPAIDLSAQSINSSSGSMLVDTPAVRGSVQCSRVSDTQFTNLTYGLDCDDCISFNISTPDGCGNGGWITTDNIWRTGSTKVPPSGTGYFGNIDTGMGQITLKSTNQTVMCPNYIATYGRIENQEIKDYNTFYCTTGFETVQTKAIIDMTLQTITSVPETYENSTVTFNQYWSPDNSIPYFIPINLTHPDEILDEYTTAMAYGKTGIPVPKLFSSPDIYIAQFTRTYRQWTAQWANAHMRESTTALSQKPQNTSNIASGALPTSLTAIYTDPNRQRLFLNEISTRILQGIIGILIICGTVIFFLVDMSRVLPKEMGSIAAVASLLAGSRFLDERSGLVPRGMEWMSDEEIIRGGLWGRERFRMGWWYDEGDEHGHGNVDLRNDADPDHDRDHDDGSAEKDQCFRIDVVPLSASDR